MISSASGYNSRFIYVLIALAVLLNFSGLFVTILGPDAALYASISKTMVQRNNYIGLFVQGADWLDKPHFPFWVTALFFKWFGFNTWTYKLPGILFLLMGAVYTYLLAKNLYNKKIALWSVVILLTAQHIVLSDNDVRAEPYLTGLIIAGVYHFYKSYTAKSYTHLIIAALFTACAVMTKGIFALIPIGGAIGGELLIKRDWKNLFHIRWIIAALLVGLFILPEVYCLYYQFDLHPEKTVFGRTNVSGIRFFFWDSQFGRFFNTGPIKGEGDPFFFLHTTLWAFLPWSLLLYIAIINFFRKNIRQARRHEWLCICGALLTFIIFSLSRFQLPHYLNIVFPFFAILTAQYVYFIYTRQTIRSVVIMQTVVIVLLVALALLVHFFYQPGPINVFLIVLLAIVLFVLFFLNRFLRVDAQQRIIFQTAWASVFINLYLNFIFYPSLLHYQSGSEAAFWINRNNSNHLPVATITQTSYYPLNFYLQPPLHNIDTTAKSFPAKTFLLYLPDEQLASLKAKGWHIRTLQQWEQFPVSQLTIPFLNKATRSKAVEKMDVALLEQ